MDFVYSPASWYRLGDFLHDGLAGIGKAYFASAFARTSGTKALESGLRSFVDRGQIAVVIGVDMQGTGIEALDEIGEIVGAENLYIFHDPEHTFHPKIYAFESDGELSVYAGSGNLTRGGLYDNHEIGLAMSISIKGRDEDKYHAFMRVFEAWTSKKNPFVQNYTDSVRTALINDGLIKSEAELSRIERRQKRRDGPKKRKLRMPTGRYERLTETKARTLVLQVAAELPNGIASTDQLIQLAPKYFSPTVSDNARSRTRPNQPRWHQIIRNVISHRLIANGPFVQGFATRTENGLRITEAGRKELRKAGFRA